MNTRRDWVLPAIVGVIVVLVGVLGIVAWLVMTDKPSTSAADEASSVPTTTLRQAPQRTSTVTVTPPQTVTQTVQPPVTVTQTPRTTIAAPDSGSAPYYAQFGAFDSYENAVAMRDQHYNSVITSGSSVGSSSRWVVVRPASSYSEAASVCAQFSDGSCVVKNAE
ncbi:hypothetical protein nbrc107696_36960 [Gordonia spumicola]|uniref:SPOR domain-containing protein n=1 Tax=Gordonia spumicola TaxID=589161 RepID=A0A7I9VE00_9ACTN|nr:SPOR domain-containing protein [Gordonia spumicola]GEE03250.1 hypothetical protein nbrc107696_36960 [Gordonia spumicola]